MTFARSLALTFVVAVGLGACDDAPLETELPFPSGVATATIGPAGGVLESPSDDLLSGFRLEVPAGALTETKTISVRQTYERTPLSVESAFVGPHFAIEPRGLAFATKVKLTVPLRFHTVASHGAPTSACKLWMREGAGWSQLSQIASTDESVTVEATRIDTSVAGVNLSVPKKVAFPVAPACQGTAGYCFTVLPGAIDPSALGYSDITNGKIGFTQRDLDDSVVIAEYDIASNATSLGARQSGSSAQFGESNGSPIAKSGDDWYVTNGGITLYPPTGPKRRLEFNPEGYIAKRVLFPSGVRHTIYDKRGATPSEPSPSATVQRGSESARKVLNGAGDTEAALIPGSVDFAYVRGFVGGRYRSGVHEVQVFSSSGPLTRWSSITANATHFAAFGRTPYVDGGGGDPYLRIQKNDGTDGRVVSGLDGGTGPLAFLSDGSVLVSGQQRMFHVKLDGSVVTIDLTALSITGLSLDERRTVYMMRALPNNEVILFMGASTLPRRIVKLRVSS